MAVITVTESNFNEIIKTDKTVLLDFFATWCGPCSKLSPIVDEIAEENPDLVVGKVDVDDEAALAGRFGVMSIPTLLVFKNGELVNKSIGGQGKAQVLELIK